MNWEGAGHTHIQIYSVFTNIQYIYKYTVYLQIYSVFYKYAIYLQLYNVFRNIWCFNLVWIVLLTAS